MIDWERITELRDEVGAEDFEEVVELFLEEVDATIDPLRNTDSLTDAEAVTHFLKGSAMNLGFAHFSELCCAAEASAAAGRAGDIDFPALVAAYDASKTVFLAELQTRLAA